MYPTAKAASVLARAYSGLEYYRSRDMDGDAWSAYVLRAREILERSPVAVRRVLDFGAGVGYLVAVRSRSPGWKFQLEAQGLA